MRWRQILGGLAGVPLGIGLVWLWQRLRRIDPALSAVALPLLVTALSAWSAVFLRRGRRVRPSGRPALRRLPGRPGRSRLLTMSLLLALLALVLRYDRIPLSSLGVSDFPPLLAFAVGAGVYLAFAWATERALRRLGAAEEFQDLALEAHALVVPRGRADKVLGWIGVVLLNPVFEEALFRGVLVYKLGAVTGHVALALALGLVVNGVNHLYQGVRLQPYHAAMYAVVVALLYSPLGLVGAIGFHFLGDLLPLHSMRSELRRYRARHRVQTPARASD